MGANTRKETAGSEYPVPENEEERLRDLRKYNILDTDPEEDYEHLVKLARNILDADIVTIGFIDEDRHWFKAAAGTELKSIPRAQSPCARTILQEGLTALENVQEEFAGPQIPQFIEDMNLKSYAAAPLNSDNGRCVGTFSVFSTRPQSFSESDLKLLRLFRDQTVSLLEHRVKATRLKESISLLDATLQSTEDGILVVDKEGNIESYNDRFVEMWGIPDSILESKEDKKAIQYVLNQLENPDKFQERVQELYDNKNEESVDLIKFKDGRLFERYSRPRFVDGDYRGRVWSFRDISEQKRKEKKIRYLAYRDHLTDLPNRLKYLEMVQRELDRAREIGEEMLFLKLDLSNVGRTNEILGQAAGDQLIVNAANRIENTLPEATVGRLMGDQFGILISSRIHNDSTPEELSKMLLEEINKPMNLTDASLQISGKIGMARFPEHGDDREELLRRANAALREAGNEMGNRIQMYVPEMKLSEREELELENDLRKAMKRDELEVFYQPFVSIPTGDITGMEALIRWDHPEHGYIAPRHIINLAQTIGQMSRLGSLILGKACKQTAEWNKHRHTPIRVSVNISAVEFVQREKYLRTVRSILDDTGLEPDSLQLEVTETEAMEDVQYTKKIMKKLKQYGVKIAIDDFGTGYSSLQYLSEFPVDMLKIDTSFVHELTKDKKSQNLVKAIINMSKELSLQVLAEGVEEEEQLKILKEFGCELYQGYLHCRPMEAEKCMDWIS